MINTEILKKIKTGAKVRVWEKIKEGDKERLSAFEGLVISRKHGNESGGTFIVRAVLQEVGVEKVFPINAMTISKVEVLSSPKKIHRSKFYFVRKLSSKKVREKLKV